MTMPDQSHINQVRDALWRWPIGGASVMVGSGFSKNADKTAFNADDLPSWRELTQLICKELYPADDARLQRALAEASATSGVLRLAQEYKSAFGRNALHRFIADSIRDDEFKPGDMHRDLLRLPWRDVFTTNWDTLLEESRSQVSERSYSIVHLRRRSSRGNSTTHRQTSWIASGSLSSDCHGRRLSHVSAPVRAAREHSSTGDDGNHIPLDRILW